MSSPRRKTRHGMRWRVDMDYLEKLSPDERAWMERFVEEYYRAGFAEDSLHVRGPLRRDVYARHLAAKLDLTTAPKALVEEAVARAAAIRRPCLVPRFYAPRDYAAGDECAPIAATSRVPEDRLIEVLFPDTDTSGGRRQAAQRRGPGKKVS